MPPAQPPRQGPSSAQVPDSKFINFLAWKKMNTKVARQNLAEDEAAWMENLQPIAPNVLQTVPAPLGALTTVSGKTVSRKFQANIGGTDYIIFCATDGSITAINASNGAQSVVATAGTFSSTPDVTVFSSARLLIMDATGGYATWDGTLLVKSGGLSPNIHVTAGGSGYTGATVVSFSGGSGSGATATATVVGGAIVSVTLTNPGSGYLAGDVVTVGFTIGTAATATVVVWPQVKGTTITIFAGRVWWANGRILNFTGTGSTTGITYDDINPADAAGSTTINDADLAHSIQAVRALNNFLYIFGDQSIKQIGSVTIQSSITLFTILTLASDIGTSFPMTIVSYNRLVLFANKQGVYGIFGATVQKISDDLDGIFALTDFSLQPSAALNDLSNQHCYLLLLKYNDPVLGARSIIVAYQTSRWFVISQGSLLSITSLPLGSTTQVETFGSGGADVTQLLQNPAVNVPITLRTSLTSNGNPVLAKQVIRSGLCITTQTAQTVTMTVDTENGSNSYDFLAAGVVTWINNSGGVVQWQNNSLGNVNFISGGFRVPYASTEGYGKFIGNTVTGSVMNLSINSIIDEYNDADPWGVPL